jgi:branched-subunit amino acid aminotransferase/4-amino-4-deoxychorismate lyase
MGVMPVTQIEKHVVKEDKSGEITARLRDAYTKALEAETT